MNVAGLHDAFRAGTPLVGRRVRVRAVARHDAMRGDVEVEGLPSANAPSTVHLLIVADAMDEDAPRTSCRLAPSAPRVDQGQDVVVEGVVVAMMGEPHIDACVVVTP
jgi:hypothetical protein